MRLNIDCIRDIMLWAEALTTPTASAQYVDIDMVEANSFMYFQEDEKPKPDQRQAELLTKYSNEVLVYHINYCIEANLLTQMQYNDTAVIVIRDLTPMGHDFIANIRHDTVFEKTKIVLNKLGVESLKAAVQVAANVASEIIKASIF